MNLFKAVYASALQGSVGLGLVLLCGCGSAREGALIGTWKIDLAASTVLAPTPGGKGLWLGGNELTLRSDHTYMLMPYEESGNWHIAGSKVVLSTQRGGIGARAIERGPAEMSLSDSPLIHNFTVSADRKQLVWDPRNRAGFRLVYKHA